MSRFRLSHFISD